MRYQKKTYDKVKIEHPEYKLYEINKIIGQMWRDLGDQTKSEYINAYEMEKVSKFSLVSLVVVNIVQMLFSLTQLNR